MGTMEPSRNRDIVPARQVTKAGGIDPLKSIPDLRKSLKVRALDPSWLLPLFIACYLEPLSSFSDWLIAGIFYPEIS